MSRKIIIGSRGSDLALWQAHHVEAQLKALGQEVEIKIIKTQGDIIQHLSFDKMEGKGFFTKELEEKLLSGEIDLAVHSHKDLPTEHPEGLIIAAVSEREDPSDMLLIRKVKSDASQKWQLPLNAVIGTSSARRKSQLLHFRKDVEIKDLRGNVPTRINKLREGNYDAIMLASAGVERLKLDLSEFDVVKLDPTEFIPAPAQGVLGLQIRQNDAETAEIVGKLNDHNVARRIGVERRILNLFEGGCQMPLGAYCVEHNGQLKVRACVADAWDAPVRISENIGSDVETLAQETVASLKA
ncbi:MAG: hydroxymethylbilane synthase [Flavobacteriales bacterium]|nr:hydroxymethylbilane synthase [Flavobacteriales bacterium]